jgi:hypothetical protein
VYIVVVARKLGALCTRCGRGIEVDDDYVPGIRGPEIAASLYKPFLKPVEGGITSSAIQPWRRTLFCENPTCRESHIYGTDDLRLYED